LGLELVFNLGLVFGPQIAFFVILLDQASSRFFQLFTLLLGKLEITTQFICKFLACFYLCIQIIDNRVVFLILCVQLILHLSNLLFGLKVKLMHMLVLV
jgi:hypothetical protein